MRTVDPRIWTDHAFLALPPHAKLYYLALATGPVGEYTAEAARKCGLSKEEWFEASRQIEASPLALRSFDDAGPVVPFIGGLTHASVVYFARSMGDEQDFIKIGFTSDIKARLSSLRIGNPLGVSLVALIRGDAQTERRLHAKFSHLRIKGEWFRGAPELTEYIEAIHRGEAEEVA